MPQSPGSLKGLSTCNGIALNFILAHPTKIKHMGYYWNFAEAILLVLDAQSNDYENGCQPLLKSKYIGLVKWMYLLHEMLCRYDIMILA